MRTNYSDARPAYECSARADRLTTPTSRSIAASTVDSAVAERLLEALNPTEIGIALAAADEVADRNQRVGRSAELAVDRARYEPTAPSGPSMGWSRKTAWWPALWRPGGNPKLAALAEAEQALEAARHTLPPLPARSELEKLAADLSGLWRASTTSSKDRKRLLRTLIADVTLLPEPDRGSAVRDPRAHRRIR